MLNFSSGVTVPSSSFFSRQLNHREERDVHAMLESAPDADPQDVNGTIVWFEWVNQGGRWYRLAYWFDGGDYQAAVMEGDNPWDRGNAGGCHLFDDRRICLKGSSDPPYSNVLEARARAIVWAMGYSDYLQTGSFPFNTIR
ncbi:MAG: hypothetical protein ACLFQ7_05195 [Phormidium sp.]